jgi:hypothetical protein
MISVHIWVCHLRYSNQEYLHELLFDQAFLCIRCSIAWFESLMRGPLPTPQRRQRWFWRRRTFYLRPST